MSAEDALRNAGRLIKEGGAEAVKLEGGVAIADTVARIAAVDIPVMGHVGLTPQSIHRMGGHRVQGRKPAARPDAASACSKTRRRSKQAGAFAIVVEGIPPSLAREITASVAIPTIGIGAGPDCDGQVLVMHDLLGLGESCRAALRQAVRASVERSGGRDQRIRARSEGARLPGAGTLLRPNRGG